MRGYPEPGNTTAHADFLVELKGLELIAIGRRRFFDPKWITPIRSSETIAIPLAAGRCRP
jgi:hypothetical protein